MSYIPHTQKDRDEMLKAIGVNSFDELIADIPEEIRFKGELNLPAPLSEMELNSEMLALANNNCNTDEYTSFLGAGIYDHYIPSVVNFIISRPEFYTAYTPYQAEVSQGTLQAIFEYQSLICRLTKMDVSNASMYDGAYSTAHSAVMSYIPGKREKIIIAETLHPFYKDVLRTYISGLKLNVVEAKMNGGITDIAELKKIISDDTACVIIPQPNFFGCVENISEIEKITHQAGAMFVMVVDPISLGIMKAPGDYNADIVVGEGQSLGNPISFGGPLLGFFACKKDLVRKMPGRLSGLTVDKNGKRGFVLTLQTREQHIRREKATSNICSNEALNALAATVYLSTLGKQGIKKVAELCLQKSHYTAKRISEINGFKMKFNAPFFKEFVIETPINAEEIVNRLIEKKIFAGVNLGQFYKDMSNCLLIAVTEKISKMQIDNFVNELKSVMSQNC